MANANITKHTRFEANDGRRYAFNRGVQSEWNI